MSRAVALRMRRPPVALRLELRPLAAAFALAALALAAAVADIAWAGADLPLGDAVAALLGGSDGGTRLIVRELQLPRALLAVLVGAALGLAGGMFQATLRNPLASPDVVGTAHGAAFAGVLALLMGVRWELVAPIACGGALAATALTLLAAPRRDPLTLVLVGVGVAAVAGAGTSFLLTVGEIDSTSRAAVWLVGSLNGTGWRTVETTAFALAALVPVALLLASRVDPLALGDDVARGLGLRAGRDRVLLLVVASALVGVAVAAVGPVGFVAFLAPQIGRRLAGTGSTAALPACTACGALLVAAGDVIARTLMAPDEIPVGIVTAVVGGTGFLVLLGLARRRVQGAGA
jgi:iron complex transport system permease protein